MRKDESRTTLSSSLELALQLMKRMECLAYSRGLDPRTFIEAVSSGRIIGDQLAEEAVQMFHPSRSIRCSMTFHMIVVDTTVGHNDVDRCRVMVQATGRTFNDRPEEWPIEAAPPTLSGLGVVRPGLTFGRMFTNAELDNFLNERGWVDGTWPQLLSFGAAPATHDLQKEHDVIVARGTTGGMHHNGFQALLETGTGRAIQAYRNNITWDQNTSFLIAEAP